KWSRCSCEHRTRSTPVVAVGGWFDSYRRASCGDRNGSIRSVAVEERSANPAWPNQVTGTRPGPVGSSRRRSSGVPTSHHRRRPAVDQEGGAVDERRLIRGEERVRGRDLIGLTAAAQRDVVALVVPDEVLALEVAVQRGVDEPRAQTVHPDAVRSEL